MVRARTSKTPARKSKRRPTRGFSRSEQKGRGQFSASLLFFSGGGCRQARPHIVEFRRREKIARARTTTGVPQAMRRQGARTFQRRAPAPQRGCTIREGQ